MGHIAPGSRTFTNGTLLAIQTWLAGEIATQVLGTLKEADSRGLRGQRVELTLRPTLKSGLGQSMWTPGGIIVPSDRWHLP